MAAYTPANPRKLTDAVAKRLGEMFRLGASIKDACRYAGIDPNTLALWRDAGRHEIAAIERRGDDPLELAEQGRVSRMAALTIALDIAMGERAKDALATIRAAGEAGDWRAAAWLLERRHPDEWGKRERVDHTHTIVAQVTELARAKGLDESATAQLIDFALERAQRRAG